MASASTDFWVVAGLVTLAVLVGGAGVSFPLLQLLLGAAAVAVAGYFSIRSSNRLAGPLDRWAWLLLGLMLALPLLQLIPLPPAIWPLLPGREIPRQVDGILGAAHWRPWTLDVEATLRSWLVLIPAAVVFAGCLRLRTQERVQLLWLIVGLALANALLGIVQLATGGGFTPYPSTHSGYPVGFFVNRNHSAALMLAAMPVAAALGSARSLRPRGRPSALLGSVSAIAVLTIVIIGTTSRAGLLLLPVALAVSLFILLRRQAQPRHALPALFAIAVLGVVLVTSRGFDRLLGRFASAEDARFVYWTDIHWALQHYGLAGTGFGTFVPVFQSSESLEGVVPQIINHAHNDYLETVLLGGIPAVLLFIAFLALIAVAIHRGVRSARRPEMASLRFAAAAGLALLLGYSLVDYPLRMPAIAAVFAILCAVLLPPSRTPVSTARDVALPDADARPARRSFRVLRLGAVAALLAVLVLMLQAGLSARAILAKRYDQASLLAFWSSKAVEGRSTEALGRGQFKAASADADAALRLSPISAPAVRNLAIVHFLEGSPGGDKIMQIAAALGWRDPLTQLWAIAAAQSSGESEKALQRAEALFRQNLFVAQTLQLLLQGSDPGPMSRLLANRLAQRPGWRSALLANLGELPPTDLQRIEPVLADLARTGQPATSEEMKPVFQALLFNGRTAEAQAIWGRLNPGLINNGDFERIDAKDGNVLPAGWDVPQESRRMSAVSLYDRGKRGLRIGGGDWVTILSQETMLPGGSYNFSYQARENGRLPVTLRWQMRCRGSSERQTAEARLTPSQSWTTESGNFTVPPRDCPIQTLALKRIEASDQSETWVDDIRFTKSTR